MPEHIDRGHRCQSIYLSRSWSRDSDGAVYRITAPLVIRLNLAWPIEGFWSVPFLDKNDGRFLSQTIYLQIRRRQH
jgi:hypothetical protein